MTGDNLIKLLRGNQLPQFDFVGIEQEGDAIVIRLERRKGDPYVCSDCGQASLFAYDSLTPRYVEDMPLGPYRLYWHFTPRRICCPHCGKTRTEQIRGLTPHSRQTDRYRYLISSECNKSSVSEVARRHGLDESTVSRIDRDFLEKRSLITPAQTCRILGIDEITLKKSTSTRPSFTIRNNAT